MLDDVRHSAARVDGGNDVSSHKPVEDMVDGLHGLAHDKRHASVPRRLRLLIYGPVQCMLSP